MQHTQKATGTAPTPVRRPPLFRAAAAGAAIGGIAAVLVVHGSAPAVGAAGAAPVSHPAVALAQGPDSSGAGRDAAATPAPTPAPSATPVPADPQPPVVPVAASTSQSDSAPAHHSGSSGSSAPTAAHTTTSHPSSGSSSSSSSGSGSSSAAAQTLALVNQDRAQNGLPALQFDAGLARAAAEHAAQNASNDQMSHNGLQADVAQQGVSYHYLGECLGQVRPGPNPGYVNSLWMQSSEHRPIILGSQFTRAGVGWAEAANGDWFVSLIVDG